MISQHLKKIGLFIVLSYIIVDNSKAQSFDPDSIIIAEIDSVSNSPFHNPSEDLLPKEFNSYKLKNNYFGKSDLSSNRPYQGNIFLISLRDNCTFVYETFYLPYNSSRIEFAIGTYKVIQDTIYLTYKPLLKGKPDCIYIKPTLSISWILPVRPECVFIDKERLGEPKAERLKKGTFYKLKDRALFDIRNCK